MVSTIIFVLIKYLLLIFNKQLFHILADVLAYIGNYHKKKRVGFLYLDNETSNKNF